ncbi:hypothetical protein CYG68_03650 [Morganella morganii]|uniref:Uncharacterized protein n=1 Tax=Morganella morganii TaxID=582 RepID=A0A8I0PZJ4_MORMO|nr:hypothetical protein [Morganella morganii]MBE8611509.1 hypothetical protein [Morganella morganii]
MTRTLNPTLTITVSGAENAGKNRVLAIIEEALRYHLGRDIIIDAPALHNKRATHTDRSKPRSGTIFKLKETDTEKQCCDTGRYKIVTSDDLTDRAVPVHIQALMSQLGVSFGVLQETDLQPVLDLVNWVNEPEIAFQNILSETDDMMKAKRNYLIGLRVNIKKTYTLSVDELSSHKALEKLAWAINRIKCDPGSYFAEGEINAMFIGDVRATSTKPNYDLVRVQAGRATR